MDPITTLPNTILVSASILSADLGNLNKEIASVTKAGADWIHIDVMDGHFVPNITFGAPIIKAVKSLTARPLDVHLMIAPVDPYIEDFVEAGASILTVHPEAGPHLHRTLQAIRAHGIKAGVAINPATPLDLLWPVMDLVDLALIMSVNPGFGGQTFIDSALAKIKILKNFIIHNKLKTLIEVDGGINSQTASKVIEAGADVLVAGTAIFKEKNYQQAITHLRGY